MVDDDEISKEMLSHHLHQHHCMVVVAGSAEEAMVTLQTEGTESFDCLISDYYMPGKTGLDLLLWSKEIDATLAFIMITGAGEKQLVADSLRCGATDYLEKPIRRKDIGEALQRAVTETREQRRLAKNDTETIAIGSLHLGPSIKSLPARIEVCHRPCHGAGGDFFNSFRLPDGNMLVLAADVSGHDLRAAFVSAYFQGIVRGMIAKNTPIPEVFSYFNQLLVEEWCTEEGKPMTISLSVCAVLIDFHSRKIQVYNNGFPIPFQITPTGQSLPAGTDAEYPLGWFSETAHQHTEQEIIKDSHFYMWTDGLEDFACREVISPWALAAKLFLDRAHPTSKNLISDASDDIMVLRIELTPDSSATTRDDVFILNERLSGERLGDIDELHAFWHRSITFVLPSINENLLANLLLCVREGMINALKYGCRGSSSQTASLMVAYSPVSRGLRVVISDPGKGHNFDFEAHLELANEALVPEHRGLGMMKELADGMCLRRNGAEVELTFALNSCEVSTMKSL